MSLPPPSNKPKAPARPPPADAQPAKQTVSAEPAKFGREVCALPPRIVLNAVEGWGKTTAGSQCPKPAILQADSETGYQMLLQAGLVERIDCATSTSWPQTLATLDAMIAAPKAHNSLVLDALNGFERQCQQYVCAESFKGDWGEKGFGGYQRGFELTSIEWIKLLARLDLLRSTHKMMILLLSHCKIRPFKNPEGPDFDRYASNVHEKVWDATKQWADAVLFGNFFTAVASDDPKQRKGKGKGGDQRVLYAVRSAAYDAKNRMGMEAILEIPDDYTQVWATIETAMNRRTTDA